ncbi:Fungal Zn(2)-Cys(6) binuclear cluster domain-containing protein [Penicillium ucsense]|uniref:Fungal Zn(2)-Cys(6) binuclear cluster domain-containing protein n=1 Tax=Penicillium ucsense TaxID=2839758 RepID=A0A8J8WA65_9EURO|nr:Fungal Zn(2)-Cys(6) binuclear cluster domain-containing protein [Penicillium ucsense]KAF7738785.1 Fungal Zn(2)-Cys(6) binuclear cluster domain-containing protein [Penicillium ucsense]
MPASSQASNVRVPKTRTKTFTGCWTCRSRRVKCDDERPVCRRCRQSGWHCQGYGLRLGWSQTPGSRSQRRQTQWSALQLLPNLSSSAVNALLADLDGWSGEGPSQERGPFTVFSLSNLEADGAGVEVASSDTPQSNSASSSAASPSTDNAHDACGGSTSLPLRPSSGEHRTRSTTTDSSSPEADSLLDDTCAAPSSRSSPYERLSATPSDIEEIVRDDFPTMLSRERADVNRYGTTHVLPGSSLSRHPSPMVAINSIQLPRPEAELIHHWNTFLSGNMLLVDSPGNACRTVFLPMALQGLEASPKEPSIHLSILHAICASSAFSLAHLRQDTRYQSLATHHDQLAIRHLRHNLARGIRLDEPTLAAVLSCITAEAMSGRRRRWRAHVTGGLALLEHEIRGGWVPGPAASRLIQSYLSLSVLCALPVSPHLMPLLDDSPDLRHYLELSHGINGPLVQFIAYITSIVDSRASIPSEELDRLEMQLHHHSSLLSIASGPGSTLVQHALNSFYYASIIYFRRNLRHASPSDVQELVEKAVEELEAVETISNERGGCAYNWANFVVAAECERADLRARIAAAFERKSRHGIHNIKVMSEVVQELWQRRDQAVGQDIHWQQIAQEADFDIMLC